MSDSETEDYYATQRMELEYQQREEDERPASVAYVTYEEEEAERVKEELPEIPREKRTKRKHRSASHEKRKRQRRREAEEPRMENEDGVVYQQGCVSILEQRLQAAAAEAADARAAAAAEQAGGDDVPVPPAAATEEDEMEEPVTKFRSPYEANFSNFEEQQEPDPDDSTFCAACFYGVRSNAPPSGWTGVQNYMRENKGKVKGPVYVRTVQAMYIRDVQPYTVDPITRKSVSGKPWPVKQIYDHERTHSNRAVNIMHEVFETELDLMRALRDKETYSVTTIRNKRTGEVTMTEQIDLKRADLIFKMGKELFMKAKQMQQLENNYLA